MPIQKPQFPSLSTAQVKAGFDKLKQAMEDVQQRNGKVDMDTLRDAVREMDDPAVRAVFEEIKDEFTVERQRTRSTGCGSTSYTSREVPEQLNPEQVQSVFSALVQAKSKTTRLDKAPKDGVIDEQEAAGVDRLRGFSGKMVQAAVSMSSSEYVSALEEWDEHLQQVADFASLRQENESEISELADYHCHSKNGAEAIKWSLRDISTREKFESPVGYGEVQETLEGAEQGPPRATNPLLAYVTGDGADISEGHLSNAEVRDLLNTRDLEGFTAKMKASVEERVGMSYEEWLEGKDLVGDEEVAEYASGSSGC